MPVVISPDSEIGKELVKWEQHRTKYVDDDHQPGNPYRYREFPKMLYKAKPHPVSGKVEVVLPLPHPLLMKDAGDLERQTNFIESFNRECQRTVMDESEERIAKGQGWSEHPQAALDLYEQEQRAIGEASAEAIYNAKRMGEVAQREFEQAHSMTSKHVVDVVPKKRGRPAKGVAPVIGTGVVESDE